MNKKQRMRKAKLIAKKKNISIVKALNDLDKYNIVMEKKKRMGRSLANVSSLGSLEFDMTKHQSHYYTNH